MCYSVESSLSAWAIANTISIYLYQRNRRYDRWNAGFISTFTTIQLLEAGLWKSMDKESKEMNDLLTRLVLLVLLLQPLSQTYLGAKYTGSETLYCLSFIFLGVFIWGLIRVGKSKPGQFSTKKGPGGHLVWTDSGSSGISKSSGTSFLGGDTGLIIPGLYFTGLFVPLLFAKDYRGVPLLATGIITALYSMYYAGGGEEFSSLWCFYAVIYAAVAVYI